MAQDRDEMLSDRRPAGAIAGDKESQMTVIATRKDQATTMTESRSHWHGGTAWRLMALAAVVCSGVVAMTISPASADDDLLASIIRGGRLYDNWYKELGESPPSRMHPAYPSDMNYADDPESNWRCSECHGWDYLGRNGAYSEGKHFTAIKGIGGMVGADPKEIVTLLKGEVHGYGALLREHDLRDLANFVTQGQIDMDRFIDRSSGRIKGDGSKYEAYYKTICTTCHGKDGLGIRTMPPLGEVVKDDPWQALHVVANGHAGENMPSLRVLGIEVLADILAYVSALPADDILPSIVRGGRLYDNWYAETDVSAPEGMHPAYPADKTFANQPAANWRCKECHGWDYLGRDGAYGSGRHFTGIKGIRGKAGADPSDIVAVLKGERHGYEALMDEHDLRDLANFVSKGQVDMNEFIDRSTHRARGDSTKYEAYYKTICATCHGQKGLRMTTMPPLGRVTRDNPWQALHKILNGHPDETMPALRSLGKPVILGILAVAQSLPEER